ncbi:MAG: hypothetical protein MUC67_05910 [Acidobacteria bacterium]|jgi:hypothetical protein|nr:hypothetical protein [Acidobacteriota bacterium]
MRRVRTGLLLALLAALAWPVAAVPGSAVDRPAPTCCCPPADGGGDGCGPRGCCCVRDGAPAESRRPEPATTTAPGPHEIVPAPAPPAIVIPPAGLGTDDALVAVEHAFGRAPARFLVLCTFRC